MDNHRAIRTGFPEVIYSRGKKPEQIRDIMAELVEKGGNIMATKATERDYEAVRERLPQAEFFEDAGIIAVTDDAHASAMNRSVAVVTAGTADIPVAEEAAVTAHLMGNDVKRIYDVGVAGIHRLFSRLEDIRSADVIIVISRYGGRPGKCCRRSCGVTGDRCADKYRLRRESGRRVCAAVDAEQLRQRGRRREHR